MITPLSPQAQGIYNEITAKGSKLGDLRTIAKELKKDHGLAMQLWSTAELHPRLLATLLFDKKELTTGVVDALIDDIDQGHQGDDRTQLVDWLMANQLMKDKKTVGMIESWKDHPKPLQRRIFWYYQGRLRWTGQNPPDNTATLLAEIEVKMLAEVPEVQWAMNFTAGWIGIYDPVYRDRCIQMGEKLGLYKDEVVARNCSPDYLPEFIRTEVIKRKL